MLLHLAESKYAWLHHPTLRVPPYAPADPFYAGCVEARAPGRTNAA